MELFETQIMVKKDKAERILMDFNKDAEQDELLDIDVFFEEDDDDEV